MTYIDIISRSTWGYRYGLGWNDRPVPARHVIIHHSETNTPSENATLAQDIDAVRYLDYIGWLRFNYADGGYKRPRGAGISYTWAVTPSGRVFQGHDINLTSSHTYGYNTSGVGICLVGNYMNTAPTEKQIDAVARLLLQAKEDGHIMNAKVDYGHKETSSTDCPGRAMESIPKINARVAEILNPPVEDPNRGYPASTVSDVQVALKTLRYYSGEPTGHLPDVDAALRRYQTDNGLDADGLPGPLTMAAIALSLEREYLSGLRIAGAGRWETAEKMALAEFPSGKGVLIAADGSPDERYATSRATGDIRYLPVRSGEDAPPSHTMRALSHYKPAWVRFIGGTTVVTDACARAIAERLGLV